MSMEEAIEEGLNEGVPAIEIMKREAVSAQDFEMLDNLMELEPYLGKTPGQGIKEEGK